MAASAMLYIIHANTFVRFRKTNSNSFSFSNLPSSVFFDRMIQYEGVI